MPQLIKALCVFTISLFITSCAFNYPKLDAYEEELSADVYFVPIGYVAPEYLISLADYYQKTFNIKVGVTERLLFVKSAWNGARKQLKTDNVIRQMKYQYWNYSFNQDAIFIGITHLNMYLPGGPSKFDFTYSEGQNFAIVSNNKLEGKSEWNFLDIVETNARFRKVVSKTIATMYFNKPLNSNSKSVLYGDVNSVLDLDYIDEESIFSDVLGRKSPSKVLSTLSVY